VPERKNIRVVIHLYMLIMGVLAATNGFGQSGLDAPVSYSARDSIVANVKTQIVKLYGEANVNYEDIQLDADYIEINLKNNEVLATYSLDSIGNPVGKPIFSTAGEESTCDYIKYNFKTKKGYIKEVRAQQDEGYIHMAESKVHPNQQVHLKNGKFTTCDLDTPHYHFKMTRAIIVPEERIVTGPVFMKLGKIPTPLAAPFGFFPQTKTRKHGLIFPEIGRANGNAGFGLKGLGYYFPLGDYWDLALTGSIYTTGQWSLSGRTNYYRKYKFNGGFGLSYERIKGYFYDTNNSNRVSINWRHTQDRKAHPTLNFSSDVNFISNNSNKVALDADPQNYFQNTFNSTLKLNKNWTAGKLKGTANLLTSLKQNASSQNYTLDLPSFKFNVNRFDFGIFRKNKIGRKWYESIQVTYDLKAKNFIQAPDSIFDINQLGVLSDYTRNGLEQSTTINSQMKLFKSRLTLTPRFNYNETWNFQYEDHFWNPADSTIDTTQVNAFRAARNLSLSSSLTGNFYGYYKLKVPAKTRFKHVATPRIDYSWSPDLGIHNEIFNEVDSVFTYISPFATSLYKERSRGSSSKLTFSLANTLKMKTKNKKDTINNTDKSFNLIDAAGIRGGYDFFKDSLNLDNFTLDFRTSKFLNIISFQTTATLNPYGYDSLNITGTEYAWNTNQGIGRITNANFIANANFTSNSGRKKQKELADKTADNAELTGFVTNNQTVNFDIPWQVNLAYNLDFKNIIKSAIDDPNYNVVQTLRVSGDFSINQKWKFAYGIQGDLQQLLTKNQENIDRPYIDLITGWNLNVWRDLHCWEATLQLGQLGTWREPWTTTNFTFLFRVNIKASMLDAIKLEYDQPPFF